MQKLSRQLPPVYALAELRAESIDPDARTVELIFYSGAPVVRVPLFDAPFELEFQVTPNAVRLERLQNGAPLLDSHNRFDGVRAILGVVEKAWLSEGTARARVRFSKRADVEPVWQDVQDRVLRNVSMGAVIHAMEEVTKKGAELKRFRATDWEPLEISLLGVGADPGAQIQAAAETDSHPCRITYREESPMRRKKCPKCSTQLAADYSEPLCPNEDCATDLEAAAAEREELARIGRIHQIAEHFGHGEVWAQQHVRAGSSAQDARADGMKRAAAMAPEIDGRLTVGNDYDSIGARIEAMSDALAARGRRIAPSDRGRRYANASIAECAFELIRNRGLSGGLDPRRDRNRVVELAMTSSDFPNLLANTLNKSLQPAFEAATPTFRAIAQLRQFKDYRPHKFVRAGDFSPMLVVGESGEITEGAIGEGGETVTALAYGRIVSLSRRVLVDDDLGAFADLSMAGGRRAADVQNSVFMNACILPNSGLGPSLADGVAVHNATHGNVASAGALSVDRIGESRALMMAQRGLESQAGKGDGIFLNTTPKFLLTSPTSLTVAEQHIATITPADVDNVNPFAGKLIALGDAHLSGTRYYLIADPAVLTTYIYGSIGGEGLRVAVRPGFEVEGVEIRISFDFAAGAVGYRGSVSGAGS